MFIWMDEMNGHPSKYGAVAVAIIMSTARLLLGTFAAMIAPCSVKAVGEVLDVLASVQDHNL